MNEENMSIDCTVTLCAKVIIKGGILHVQKFI